MQAVTVRELKEELKSRSPEELMDLCLRLARFKKENKELLTYLLFEAGDEEGYIQSVKNEIDTQFEEINTRSYYFIRKSIRKTLRRIKTYIRYSKKKETEVELLLYFCFKLKTMQPSYRRSTRLEQIYAGQIRMIRKAMAKLHEDLQYDYELELEKL